MFFRKTKKQSQNSNPFVIQLADRIRTVQRKGADYLQQKAGRLSIRTLRYGLVTFCLLSSVISVGVAVQGFQRSQTTALNITPIHSSSKRLQTGAETLKTDHPITQKEYLRILHFRNYLDSLRQTPGGSKVHFRLLYNRRGLLDSLRQVETLYHLQQHLKR
jgi:hypothetical protein